MASIATSELTRPHWRSAANQQVRQPLESHQSAPQKARRGYFSPASAQSQGFLDMTPKYDAFVEAKCSFYVHIAAVKRITKKKITWTADVHVTSVSSAHEK